MELLQEPQLIGDTEILCTRVFDAPRKLVWKVWTEREHIERWWGPNGFTTTTHAMDVKPGGVWRFVMHGPDGRDYENKITYVEVVNQEKLSYRHADAGPEDEKLESVSFQVSVTFEELREDAGARTKLTMRMVFPNPKARQHVIEAYGALEGMKQTLGRLGEYLPHAA